MLVLLNKDENFKMTEKERSNICADKTSECYKNSLEHDDCERHPPFRLDGVVSNVCEYWRKVTVGCDSAGAPSPLLLCSNRCVTFLK